MSRESGRGTAIDRYRKRNKCKEKNWELGRVMSRENSRSTD
jgi:hypothetical protein